jgi:hypothetical protein
MEAQTNESLLQGGNQTAMQQAIQKKSDKIENPFFLQALQDADVESPVFDWLEDDHPDWFSGANIVGNQGEHWSEHARLLMQNRRERALAERNPGRLVRDDPFLLAVAQDVSGPDDPMYREPMTEPKRRALYGSAEVAANLMSLSADARGIEATTTATTESRVTRQDSEKSESRVEKLGGLYK